VAAVGHALKLNTKKDRGTPGKFNASHAEKQLIAYFLDRHVFLPEDTEIRACEDRKELHSRLNRLSEIAPKHRMTGTAILISAPKHLICPDCAAFKDSVNRVLVLSITLHERTL
jgi:hypothetical protein